VPWREAVEHRELTAEYSATANFTFGECLAYLAASSDMEESVKLLKGRRWLLDYDPRASVATRLMLRFFGVGRGRGWKKLKTCLRLSFHGSFGQLY
jgi:hypothetical protein